MPTLLEAITKEEEKLKVWQNLSLLRDSHTEPLC